MTTTNSALRRIEAGALITINDGTTTHTVLVLEPGTVKWGPGWYEPLEWTDRGVNQVPYEGDERPGSIEMSFKYTGANDAADLKKFLSSRDATTGKMKMYTWVIKNPSVKGGSTGEQLTFANCYIAPDGLEVQAGTKFDLLNVKMRFVGADVATTTY